MNGTITLPSGCTIDGQTWSWMKEDGTWRGYLDEGMYSQADRDFMDRELARKTEENDDMDFTAHEAQIVDLAAKGKGEFPLNHLPASDAIRTALQSLIRRRVVEIYDRPRSGDREGTVKYVRRVSDPTKKEN